MGFPGEPPEAYARMAELIPLVVHLMPPNVCVDIPARPVQPELRRPGRHGARGRPARRGVSARLPAPRRSAGTARVLLRFDYADGRRPETYTASVTAEVEGWQALLRRLGGWRPRLDLFDDGERAGRDRHAACRRPRRAPAWRGSRRGSTAICDDPRSVQTVVERLGEPEASVRAAIDRLIEARLLVEEGGRCLSLAGLPRAAPAPEGRPCRSMNPARFPADRQSGSLRTERSERKRVGRPYVLCRVCHYLTRPATSSASTVDARCERRWQPPAGPFLDVDDVGVGLDTWAHRLTATRVRIGRAHDNDVVLDDRHVSAHHAVLRRDPSGAWRDRGPRQPGGHVRERRAGRGPPGGHGG
jgi:hypothetical protein